MSQTRTHSIIEVVASTLTGYVIAIITQMMVFPLYGIPVNMSYHYQIAAIFTCVSIVRGYFFRRLFNWLTGGWNG